MPGPHAPGDRPGARTTPTDGRKNPDDHRYTRHRPAPTDLKPVPAEPGRAPACRRVPGYAAGPGYPAPALNAAAQAGWTEFQDKVANVTYTSPDRCARLSFGPETNRYAACRDELWQATYITDPTASITASGATHWAATFGDYTPAEAIAAFLTAVARPVRPEAEGEPGTFLYAAGPGDHLAVCTVCDQAGWVLDPHRAEHCHLSADTTMRMTYRAPYPDRRGQAGWQAVYHPIDTDRRWSARFTPAVPAAAITAFLSVLTDPAGLDPDRA